MTAGLAISHQERREMEREPGIDREHVAPLDGELVDQPLRDSRLDSTDPVLAAARLDEQKEAVAITQSARPRSGLHGGHRELF
jgi:hypothetical protein